MTPDIELESLVCGRGMLTVFSLVRYSDPFKQTSFPSVRFCLHQISDQSFTTFWGIAPGDYIALASPGEKHLGVSSRMLLDLVFGSANDTVLGFLI